MQDFQTIINLILDTKKMHPELRFFQILIFLDIIKPITKDQKLEVDFSKISDAQILEQMLQEINK